MPCCSNSASTILGAVIAAAAGLAIVNFSGAGLFGSCGSSSDTGTEIGANIAAVAAADTADAPKSSCCPLSDTGSTEVALVSDDASAIQQVAQILGTSPDADALNADTEVSECAMTCDEAAKEACESASEPCDEAAEAACESAAEPCDKDAKECADKADEATVSLSDN